MTTAAAFATAACLLVAMISGSAAAGTHSEPPAAPRTGLDGISVAAAPGEVLVRFRPAVTAGERRAAAAAAGASLCSPRWGHLGLVRLPAKVDPARAMAALRAHPDVAHVEPNYLFGPTDTVPNDPGFPYQWGLSNTGQSHPVSGSNTFSSGTDDADMDVSTAWDTQQGANAITGDSPVIAILDAGIDIAHPDIAPNLWVNPGEIANDGIDNDRNGYEDDVNGWDFAQNDNTLLESNSAVFGWDHGTHVAGIAAAAMNDSTGIAGVCPKCKVMVLKIMKPLDVDRDGKKEMVGDLASEIEGVRYAAKMGADVVNGSFGNYVIWSKLQRAAYKAAGDAGVLAVSAAGNDRGDNDLLMPFVDLDADEAPDSVAPSYPAGYELSNVISVAASNDRDEYGYFTECPAAVPTSKRWLCSFTNWGRSSVDVAAPGVDIYSSVPNGAYAAFDGTSMAAPQVAGVAGLVTAQHPGYSPRQVKAAILNAVDRPATLSSLQAFPGPADTGIFTLTGGRVNAAAALTASSDPIAETGDGKISRAVSLSRIVAGSVRWPEDVNDVFRKRLVTGNDYRVVLDGPRDEDFDLQIYKPGTKEIWQLEVGCLEPGAGPCKFLHYAPEADADESRTFTARSTGTYYFHVSAWIRSAGAYTLKIVRV